MGISTEEFERKMMMEKTGNTFTTGSGQNLSNVHHASACAGEHCVIHNPSDHAMKDFPTYWRSDRGIMERICPHGVGHPDPDSPWALESMQWVHGCDGCCSGNGPYQDEDIPAAGFGMSDF